MGGTGEGAEGSGKVGAEVEGDDGNDDDGAQWGCPAQLAHQRSPGPGSVERCGPRCV